MKKIRLLDHKVKSGVKEIIKTRQFLDAILNSEKVDYLAVTIIFCTDKYLLSINKKFLNHETLTDVITFNLSENSLVQGEIYISIERVRENAKKYAVSYLIELRRIMTHGILHLCGYTDSNKKDKRKMVVLEDFYLKKFDVPRETL